MKIIVLAAFLGCLISFGASATENAWLDWEEQDSSAIVVNLSYRGNGKHSAGSPATIAGTITAASKDSGFWGRWQWGLKESLQKRGLDFVATFPDDAKDVTSSITFQAVGKNQIKFTYQTANLSLEDLNRFSLRVYDNKGDRKKIAHLLLIQTKLERRLEKLNRLRDDHKNKRSLQTAIDVISAHAANLESLIEKIRSRLNSDEAMVADFVLPLQVDNIQTGSIRTSTKTEDFKLELISEPGILIQGMKPTIKTIVTRLKDSLKKDYYLPQIKLDGAQAVTTSATNFATNPVSYQFTTQAPLSVSQAHSAEISLYQWDSKKQKKKDLEASLSMPLPVVVDDVAPTWLTSSTPSGMGKYLQLAEPVALTVQDSFGRIDPSSLNVTLTGQTTSGQPVSKSISNLTASDLGQGDAYLFSGELNPLEDGSYSLSASVKDQAGDLAAPNPWKATFQIDTTKPIIALGVQDGISVREPVLALPVSVTDASPFEVKVYHNEQLIHTGTENSFTLSVPLARGDNSFRAEAIDVAGNIATPAILNSIVFARPAEILSSIPADGSKIYVKQLPAVLSLSATVSEVLTSASVNEIPLIVLGDGKQLSGQHTFTEAGLQTLQFVFIDTFTFDSNDSIQTEVVVDNTAPTVTIGATEPLLTNQVSYSVPVTVIDENPTVTSIKVNGAEQFQTFSKSFSAPLVLDREGDNLLEIVSEDAAGNISNTASLTIKRDTLAPILSFSAPSGQVDRVAFEIIGTANEPVKAISVNGSDLHLGTDAMSFDGMYVAQTEGQIALDFIATDRAGNTGTHSRLVEVTSKLLVPELVYFRATSEEGKYLVIGAAGSTRPNVEINARENFLSFNRGSTTSASDGSFQLLMEQFDNLTITAYDPAKNQTSEMTLAFELRSYLTGVVKDTDSNPLPNARVSLANSTSHVFTDGAGVFVLTAPETGDQSLVVDGSFVPRSISGPNRIFSQTKLFVNIGVNQFNVVQRPVFLAPLYLDGSETKISPTSTTIVESERAPGVSIAVPAGVTQFPTAVAEESINISTIAAERSTIPVPASAVPSTVIALEPSGLKFNERVDLKVPNETELPPGVEFVILSMDSSTGTWGVDGAAVVSQDGGSIETKPGLGISHFSTIYAVPAKAILKTVTDPNSIGTDVSQGSLTTGIRLPSFKALGQTITPSLVYKSSWANPTAFVSNMIDIPRQEISWKINASRHVEFESRKHCIVDGLCYGRDEYFRQDLEDHREIHSWYEPDEIKSQLYIANTSSEQIQLENPPTTANDLPGLTFKNGVVSNVATHVGEPVRSIISYAVPLKDGNGTYLPSGIYPTLARFQIKLRNMTLTTGLLNNQVVHDGTVLASEFKDYNKEPKLEKTVMDEVLPQDLVGAVVVQNKVASPFGRGWHLNLSSRIVTPQGSRILIEEADGSPSTYAPDEVIETLYNGADSTVDFDSAADVTNWPRAYVLTRNSNNISALFFLDLQNGELTPLTGEAYPQSTGTVVNQNSYLCSDPTSTQAPHFYSYKAIARLGGIATAPNGNVFTTNLREHNLTQLGGSSFARVAGKIGEIDSFGNMSGAQFAQMKEGHRDDICTEFSNSFFNGPSELILQICKSVSGADCTFAGTGTAYLCGVLCKYDGDVNCSARSGPALLQKKYTYAPDPIGVASAPNDGLLDRNFLKSCQKYRSGAGFGVGSWVPDFVLTSSIANGPGFNNPKGIAVAPDGSIIVADSGNNLVRKFDLTTRVSSPIAGNGGNTDTGADGEALSVSIYHPMALTFDDSGRLYITSENGYVRRLNTDGSLVVIAGKPPGEGVLADEAPAKEMVFNKSAGLVVDSTRNYLYVADTGNHRVVRVDMNSNIASTIAGSGNCNPAITGDNGAALAASLCSPTSIGLDDKKNLIVVDSGHKRIRRVNLNHGTDGTLALRSGGKDGAKLFRNSDGTLLRTFRNGNKEYYSADGLIDRAVDRVGNQVTFSYDAQGRVTTVTDQAGQQTTASYSGDLISSITDPAGRTTYFNFTGDLLTSVFYPDSTSQFFEYDAQGQLVKEFNQNGKPTKYTYNEYNRLSTVTDVLNNTVTVSDSMTASMANRFTSGTSGPLARQGMEEGQVSDKITDARNVETELKKDLNGFISTIKDGKGNITKIDRDALGNPLSITNPDNSVVRFTYDPITNDLLSTTDEGTGTTESTTYDVFGSVLTKTDGRGLVFAKAYDSKGLVSAETNPGNILVTYSYTAKGQIRTRTVTPVAGQPLTTLYDYDTRDRLKSVTTPDGKVTSYEYDNAGNVVKSTSQFGGVLEASTFYEFDAFNRLKKVTSPKNEVTAYSYHPTGELTSITDPQSKVRTFEYDDKGRLLKKTDATGQIYEFAYDANDNVVEEKDPNGNIKKYTYDELNRMAKAELPDDLITYEYDFRGDATQISNYFSTISYTRDTKGRVVQSVTTGAGPTAGYPEIALTSTYDGSNNRRVVESSAHSIAFNYDPTNRLTQISNTSGDVFNFTYDSANRLTQVTRPGSLTNFTYTPSGLVQNVNHLAGSTTRGAFSYTYDQRNYPIQKQTLSGTFGYGYDANGQLTSVTGPLPESFAYDSIGNRTSDQNGSYSYDSTLQRLQEDWQYAYHYDNNGNLLAKIPKLEGLKAYQFTYSSKNQLIEAKVLASALGQIEKQIFFAYDAIGRRIQKRVVDQVTPGNSYARKYVYDGDNIFLEFDGDNNVIGKYTHSPLAPDDILSAEITASGVAAGLAAAQGRIFFLKDALGSVTNILNSSGAPIQHYEYSAYGKIMSVRNSNSEDISASPLVRTSFTYTGRELESELGLYYYRARYYDPATGRFLQQDPHPGVIEKSLAVVNSYIYALNNPNKYLDPSGNFVFLAAALLTIGFESAVAGAIGIYGAAMLTGALAGVAALEFKYGLNTAEMFRNESGASIGLAALIGGLGGAFGKWAGELVGGHAANWINRTFDFASKNFVRQTSVGYFTGAFTSSSISAGLISGNLVKGSASDVGNSFLFGGLAGGITGGANYYFHTHIATPVTIINEAGWQFSTGAETE